MLRRILRFEAKRQAPEVSKALELNPSLQMQYSPKTGKNPKVANSCQRQLAPPSQNKFTTKVPSCASSGPGEPTVDSNFKKILNIISEESGVDVRDLSDHITWPEIGIDSLLTLQITGRIREEIDLDMDLDDLLVRFSTVNELRNFFGSGVIAGAYPKIETTGVAVEHAVAPLAAPCYSEKRIDSPNPAGSTVCKEALAIISDVTGIDEEELKDEVIFADIGVDSLMSLMLTSRLQDELELEIAENNFGARFHTVGDLRSFLFDSSESEGTSVLSRLSSSNETSATTPVTPSVVLKDPSLPSKTRATSCLVPSASSVVLQGAPKKARITMFLFPDGAGSATSYSSIPPVGPDVAVVGLNSPYYKDPSNFVCSVDELIDAYLAEIRRRQPIGPYHFAGWSAGGILAYHATYRMVLAGEEIEHLILIDSPVPKGLDHLPPHFYEFLSKHQVFGHATNAGPVAQPPDWLFPHFKATIDTLHDYVAKPLPKGTMPRRTSLIWAGQSVLSDLKVDLPPRPDDTQGMNFLTKKHPTFEGNGWEDLFPDGRLHISVAEAANHFSMMVSLASNYRAWEAAY